MKQVYGLKGASRQWYQTVRDEFCKLGFESCNFEPSLFVKREGSQVAGILCIHVEDFLIAGKSDFLRETKDSLDRAFTVDKESKCPLTFTGLSIMWNNGIEVRQKNYVDDLEEIELSSDFDKNAPLTADQLTLTRGALGKLQGVASQTRPDLSFLSTSLAIDLANCKQDRINDINKTILKARYRSDFCMKYPCMTGLDRLILFADASFQNLPWEEVPRWVYNFCNKSKFITYSCIVLVLEAHSEGRYQHFGRRNIGSSRSTRRRFIPQRVIFVYFES